MLMATCPGGHQGWSHSRKILAMLPGLSLASASTVSGASSGVNRDACSRWCYSELTGGVIEQTFSQYFVDSSHVAAHGTCSTPRGTVTSAWRHVVTWLPVPVSARTFTTASDLRQGGEES